MGKKKPFVVNQEVIGGKLKFGEYITIVTTFRNGRTNQSGGTYIGVRPDEEDGTPYHLFVNGYIGVTQQSMWGFPVDQLDNAE